MAWADTLQQGSFRGAPFKWDASTGAFGRRGQNHEYPLRDKPYFEDLGRKARGFTLTVYTVGPNYAAERDALITACETAGAGQLVHPLFGAMKVTCTDCQVSETTREGGKATFTLTFVEPGDISFNAAVVDTTVPVVASATALQDASVSSFDSTFDVTAVAPSVLDQALADLKDVVGVVRQAAQLLSSVPTSLAGLLAQVQSFTGVGAGIFSDIVGIGSGLLSLVRYASFIQLELGIDGNTLTSADWSAQISFGASPSPVAGALTAAQIAAAYATQMSIASAVPSIALPPPTTPARATQAANQAALFQLLTNAALAEAAQAASASSFDNAEAALAVRDSLGDLLDAAMNVASDDALFSALRDLRVAVVTDLTQRAANLPHLMTLTLPEPRSALVLAHLIYDDPSFAADIVARNGVRHPSFVPAQTPITVLSDV